MSNWFLLAGDYLSKRPNYYTWFGLAESINRITLICMWTVSTIFWLLTNVQAEGMYWFFTVWVRLLNVIDVLRLILVLLLKTIGVFDDKKQMYLVDDGTNMSVGYSSTVSLP